MSEIKYKAFNSYIDKLIRAFNSRTAPIAIWSDSLFRYKEVEQEIESNIVFLTPEQCRNYIAGLIRQVEKNINTIHDNSEAVKQFLQAGNFSEEAMDETRMTPEIVPDAFMEDIPTNAQLKYEGYTDDDISNGRMLQQYYVRKRLVWLIERIREYEIKENAVVTYAENTAFEPSYSSFSFLMNTFDYSDYNKRPAYLFYRMVVERLNTFKSEFHGNMMHLQPTQQTYYIEKLLTQLDGEIKYIGQGEKRAQELCTKHGIKLEDLMQTNTKPSSNPLLEKLNIFPQYDQLRGQCHTPQDIMQLQEEFYHYFYGEGIRQIIEFLNQEKAKLNNQSDLTSQTHNKEKPKKSLKADKQETSFGFTGDSAKLLKVLNALQLRLRKKLIKEAKCTIEDLHVVLTTDTLSGTEKTIWFSCETTQLAYLLRKLKQFFTNFEDDLIESSKLFITSKGSNLSAQNIRKSYSETPEPKDFEVIDQLIAELSRS